MAKDLVLVGGGHAHMTILLRLRDYVNMGHRVTLISPSPYHYYSGMGPGMLSEMYRPGEARFHVKKMAKDRGGNFVEDRVVSVDPDNRLLHMLSGQELHYDVVSFNTGSHVPVSFPGGEKENVFPVKPIENLLRGRRKIVDRPEGGRLRVIVVGGGPAGVEISANIWRFFRLKGISGEIELISGSEILADFPQKARRLARNSLLRKGITITEGDLVTSVENEGVTLTGGKTVEGNIVFVAVGVTPSPLFFHSGLAVGEEGGLTVNSYLQSVRYPEIFGGGDCISLEGLSLAKVGVYALRQNPILFHNLKAALRGNPLRAFDPGGTYLLILNMGDGRGIFWRNNFVLDGKLAFFIKDYIDRRFMRKFQVSGELGEKW